jgi:hypothetical protein
MVFIHRLTLYDQPEDHLWCICKFLSYDVISALSETCKRFRHVINYTKELSHGAQVKAIKQLFIFESNDSFNNTVRWNEIKLKQLNNNIVLSLCIRTSRDLVYRLPVFNTNLKDCYFKNLKFISESCNDMVELIELEIGGNRINKVYGTQFKIIRHLTGIEDQLTVPLYFNMGDGILSRTMLHEIMLHVRLKEDVSTGDTLNFGMTVDTYELDPDHHTDSITYATNNHTTEYMCIQSSLKEEPVNTKEVKITIDRMCANVSHLMFQVPENEIESISIDFTSLPNRVDVNGPIEKSTRNLRFDANRLDKFSDFYIIPFTTSLTVEDLKKYCVDFLLRNNTITITLKHDPVPNQKCILHSMNINFIRTWGGMQGLKRG